MCCHKLYGALRQVFHLLRTLIWKQLPSLLLGSPSLSRVLVWGSSTWLSGFVANWWVWIHRVFRWILYSSCLPRFPWLMLSTNCGGMVFPMSSGLWMTWTMMSLTRLLSLPPFLLLHFLARDDTQLWWLCQGVASSTTRDFVDPSHLPWLVYAYGLNGFARERHVGRNPNVMGYLFPEGTRVVSSLSSLSCLFFSYITQNLF